MSRGEVKRRSNIEVIWERVKRRVGGNSGLSGQAGREISGRQRNIDRAVEEAERGKK